MEATKCVRRSSLAKGMDSFFASFFPRRCHPETFSTCDIEGRGRATYYNRRKELFIKIEKRKQKRRDDTTETTHTKNFISHGHLKKEKNETTEIFLKKTSNGAPRRARERKRNKFSFISNSFLFISFFSAKNAPAQKSPPHPPKKLWLFSLEVVETAENTKEEEEEKEAQEFRNAKVFLLFFSTLQRRTS